MNKRSGKFVEDESGPSFKTPKKKARRSTDYNLCLRCQKPDNLCIGQLESIQKFCDAAEVHNDDVYSRIKGDIEAMKRGKKKVLWHSACYKAYTHCKGIAKKRKSEVESESLPQTERVTRSASTDNVFAWNKCMFCQKTYKNRVKKLFQVCTLNGQNNIISAVQKRNDKTLKMHIDNVHGDLIAIDAKYHKQCRDTYIKESDDVSNKDDNINDKCFMDLVDVIDEGLMYEKKTYEMSNLLQMYTTLIQKVQPDSSVTMRSLKNKLIKHYGEDNIVFQDQYDPSLSQLVYSRKISLKNVINTVARHNDTMIMDDGNDYEVDSTDSKHIPDASTTLFHASQIIRESVKKCKGIVVNPLDTEDISLDQAKSLVPTPVFNLLKWIIDGCDSKDGGNISSDQKEAPSSSQSERQILSIGQDLIFAVSKGTVKTPKHVGYSMTVKHKTNSRQLVTLAHHAGHGISYNDVVRIEKALEDRNKERSGNGIYVPGNIIPGAGFIHGAADNIDFNEETLDGRKTTHATSMVLYQNTKHHSEMQEPQALPVPDIPEFQECNKHPSPAFSHQIQPTLFGIRTDVKKDSMKETMWLTARMDPQKLYEQDTARIATEQSIPGWSPFNTAITSTHPTKTTIGYCAPLPDPPTEDKTVYTTMKNFIIMNKKLGQDKAFLTLDLAIYCKAKVIQWNFPVFNDLIIRLGGFHIALNFLGCIGNLYMGSGLEEWVVEGDVYGPNTLAKILAGKQYNRGVRACKLIAEALYRKKWQAFWQWAMKERKVTKTQMDDIAKELKDFESVFEEHKQDIDLESLSGVQEKLSTLGIVMSQFTNEMKGKCRTFAFWNNLLDMVLLLLQYIRAERMSNWQLHLDCVTQMIPYFIMAGHTNYFRWATVYIADMRQLEVTAPEVYAECMNGEHTVSRSGNIFGSVWSDMALEQSANCHSKSKMGGTVGLTQKQETNDRWWYTVHDRGAIADKTSIMLGMGEQVEAQHKESSKYRVCKDEKDVQSLVELLGTGMSNPFTCDATYQGHLVNIATGIVLPDEDADKLISVKETGQGFMDDFIEERLIKRSVPFFNAVHKPNIKTFHSLSKPMLVGEQKVAVKSDPNIFSRLLVAAQNRKIDLKNVLSYEISAVPAGLARSDGSLNHGVKSQLLKELEKIEKGTPAMPPSAGCDITYIIDGMALIHTLKVKAKTFGQLSDEVLAKLQVFMQLPNVIRTDIVFDIYNTDDSIKAGEHAYRQRGTMGHEIKILSNNTHLPQGQDFQQYLKNPQNKSHLTLYLGKSLASLAKVKLRAGQTLVLSYGNNKQRVCHIVRNGVDTELPQLASHQDEADGVLLLHASHAANIASRIVICSPDTDVAVLCVHFCSEIGVDLWFKTGSKGMERYIHINPLVQKLGDDLTQTILPFHTLTGTDSTSFLSGRGRGKAQAWKHLATNIHKFSDLKHLGDGIEISESTHSSADNFICSLYDKDNLVPSADLNVLRYRLFTQPGKEKMLPPTKDSYHQHKLRSNYLSHKWKLSLKADAIIPSPIGHGWRSENDGTLLPVLTTKPNAPEAVVELTRCGCKTGCVTKRCSCSSSNLMCTAACKCKGEDMCHNPLKPVESDTDSSDEDSSDSE